MRRTILSLLFIALPSVSWAESTDKAAAPPTQEGANAEDDVEIGEPLGRKTLADRIPAVSRPTFLRKGRFEITPSVGLSFNDPFFDNYLLGVGGHYHIFESLAVGATGTYYASSEADLPVAGDSEDPTLDRSTYDIRGDVMWSPLYGKISLFAEKILHFDTYIAGGIGMVGAKEGDSSMTLSAAVGQHFFLSDWLAFRWEIRDQFFNRSPGVVTRADDSVDTLPKERMSVISATFGFSFYLPTGFKHDEL